MNFVYGKVSIVSFWHRLLLFVVQELPERWEGLKKQCDLVRQQLAPLKANEVTAIKKKIGRFETQQSIYREKFKNYSFFLWVY